jgi:hypothetical protein
MAGERDGAALAQRAADLRARFTEQNRTVQTRMLRENDQINRDRDAARARATTADAQADAKSKQAADFRREAEDLGQRAKEADGNGLDLEAKSLREQAADRTNLARTAADVADTARHDADTARAEVTSLDARHAQLAQEHQRVATWIDESNAQLDRLDDKARYLQEADGHDANATRLRDEAQQLRDAGKTEDADRKTAQAVDEDIAAGAKRGSADDLEIDETKLQQAGEDPVGSGANAMTDDITGGGFGDTAQADTSQPQGSGALDTSNDVSGLAGADALADTTASFDGDTAGDPLATSLDGGESGDGALSNDDSLAMSSFDSGGSGDFQQPDDTGVDAVDPAPTGADDFTV